MPRLDMAMAFAAGTIVVVGVWLVAVSGIEVTDNASSHHVDIIKVNHTLASGQIGLRPKLVHTKVSTEKTTRSLQAEDLIAELLEGEFAELGSASPAVLFQKVRQESRDNVWAVKSEEALKGLFSNIPYLDPQVPMHVRCASTICEISGAITAHATIDNINVSERALQAPSLQEMINKEGFSSEKYSITFGSAKKAPFSNVFVKYVIRS